MKMVFDFLTLGSAMENHEANKTKSLASFSERWRKGKTISENVPYYTRYIWLIYETIDISTLEL